MGNRFLNEPIVEYNRSCEDSASFYQNAGIIYVYADETKWFFGKYKNRAIKTNFIFDYDKNMFNTIFVPNSELINKIFPLKVVADFMLEHGTFCFRILTMLPFKIFKGTCLGYIFLTPKIETHFVENLELEK